MAIQWCAAVMDWLLFLVMFVVLYGAGEHGFSTGQCAWLGAAMQATYMTTSLALGFLISSRNARALAWVAFPLAFRSSAMTFKSMA